MYQITLRDLLPGKCISCIRELAKNDAGLLKFGCSFTSSPNAVDVVIKDNFEAITMISSTNVFKALAAILADDI